MWWTKPNVRNRLLFEEQQVLRTFPDAKWIVHRGNYGLLHVVHDRGVEYRVFIEFPSNFPHGRIRARILSPSIKGLVGHEYHVLPPDYICVDDSTQQYESTGFSVTNLALAWVTTYGRRAFARR